MSRESIIDRVLEITESDILQIFGESGSGKTTFVVEMLKEAHDRELSALFIDTERNLTKSEVEALKINYQYAPALGTLMRTLKHVLHSKEHYDVIVVDSLGLPVLGAFAKMSLNERGNALLMMQQILYDLKAYAFEHNTAIVFTNQPESAMMKPQGHELRPFGDKSIFFVKEIWKTYLVSSSAGMTECKAVAFRSRKWGRGTEIYRMYISPSEKGKKVVVKWKV